MFSEFKKAYHEIAEKNAKAFLLVREWVLRRINISNENLDTSMECYAQAVEAKGSIDNELKFWRTNLSDQVVEAQTKNNSLNQEIDQDLTTHRVQVVDPVIAQSDTSTKDAETVLRHSETVLKSLHEQNARSLNLKKSLVDALTVKGDKHIVLTRSLESCVGEFGVSKERFAKNASSLRKQISRGNSKIALSEKLLSEVEGLNDVE